MEMLKEGGIYSLTRAMVVANYVLFIIGTAYLIYTGKTWGNYDTFACIMVGGGAITQISNKFINSKYNSPLGEKGKPLKEDVNV